MFFNEDFTRKVLPFIKDEYFSNSDERILYGEIFKFVEKYNNLTTKDTILIELNGRKDLTEEQLKNIRHIVVAMKKKQIYNGCLIQLRSGVKIEAFTMRSIWY